MLTVNIVSAKPASIVNSGVFFFCCQGHSHATIGYLSLQGLWGLQELLWIIGLIS